MNIPIDNRYTINSKFLLRVTRGNCGIVEKTKTGYSAYAEKYPVYTVGNSLEELKTNMLEALNLFFEAKGKTITEKDLKITLDMPQFFEFYKVINAKALSERIGMNQSLL